MRTGNEIMKKSLTKNWAAIDEGFFKFAHPIIQDMFNFFLGFRLIGETT